MNKIEKQFQKKEQKKNNKIRKWWSKNSYKVFRVVFFYIWIPALIHKKLKDSRYKKLEYDDKITKKYLDKVMPKLVPYCLDTPAYILFHNTNDFGGIRFYWDLCSNWMARKFKKETKYFSKFHALVQNYIIEEYQIDGYEKMVLDNWNDWNRASEKFDWGCTPYNKDYAKGVIFYKENLQL
jgi:hypothetical protein